MTAFNDVFYSLLCSKIQNLLQNRPEPHCDFQVPKCTKSSAGGVYSAPPDPVASGEGRGSLSFPQNASPLSALWGSHSAYYVSCCLDCHMWANILKKHRHFIPWRRFGQYIGYRPLYFPSEIYEWLILEFHGSTVCMPTSSRKKTSNNLNVRRPIDLTPDIHS